MYASESWPNPLTNADKIIGLVRLLDQHKAEDIKLLHNDHHLVIATCLSPLHIRALANYCRRYAKSNQLHLGHCPKNLSRNTEWACIQIDQYVIHLMTIDTRNYFDLGEDNCE